MKNRGAGTAGFSLMLQPRVSQDLSRLRHGLRTPLNHILGYSEMLLEGAPAGSAAGEALRTIIAEAQRACDCLPAAGGNNDNSEAGMLSLRSDMRPHVTAMSDQLPALANLDNTDVDRMKSAVSQLMLFVRSGELAPAAAASVTPRVHPRGDQQPGSARVLIVDEDENNRDILRRQLSRHGYDVVEAASGRAALRALRGNAIDAVLLDLVMGDINGLEVLNALKTDEHLREIPVLVISAADELGAVAASIARGAEDYLFKPFDPVLLHARLSATLERKRLRDQERTRNAALERVTAALKRSNEDLQRFAYAASHDLQAPVRTVTAYLQLLERRLGPRLNEDEREMIAFAQGAARRMHTLIQDLLTYSRASTAPCHLETVDCEELVTALVDDLRSIIEEAGATVTWDPMPRLVADATGIRQVLQNLLTNAMKYRREEPPHVHLSLIRESDHWRFCVRDNGQGIEPEYTARIFEMFQRLHGDDIPGSGIGLAICQRIVDRRGGRIWVDSEPGRGSTFCFTLPFHPETGAAA